MVPQVDEKLTKRIDSTTKLVCGAKSTTRQLVALAVDNVFLNASDQRW